MFRLQFPIPQILAQGSGFEIAYHYLTASGEEKTDSFKDRVGENTVRRKITKMTITQTALIVGEMSLTVKIRVCVEVRQTTLKPRECR